MPHVQPGRRFPRVPIKILKRDWVSHQVISYIAAILLSELDYDVTIVDNTDEYHLQSADPSTREMDMNYRFPSEGAVDMNLEVWRSSEKRAVFRRWVANTGEPGAE